MGLLSHDNTSHYSYAGGPPPLYISYVSPKQIKQHRHQEILGAAGDKGHWIKKVTKVKESKQWAGWIENTFCRQHIQLDDMAKWSICEASLIICTWAAEVIRWAGIDDESYMVRQDVRQGGLFSPLQNELYMYSNELPLQSGSGCLHCPSIYWHDRCRRGLTTYDIPHTRATSHADNSIWLLRHHSDIHPVKQS